MKQLILLTIIINILSLNGMASDMMEIEKASRDLNIANNKMSKELNKKKLVRNIAEGTLHIVNVACGIAGTYWGIEALIEESDSQKSDPGQISVSVMGGLVSGFGSAASGILGLARMITKIIITHRNKTSNNNYT